MLRPVGSLVNTPHEIKLLRSERLYFTVRDMATKKFMSDLEKWRKRREQMLAMINGGASMADVGRKFKISRQRVRQIVK